MKAAGLIGKVLLASLICVTLAYASDPTAVYARIDRVVLEPNADAPQAMQVWGVFAMAKPDDRNDYLPPARGYLYFSLTGGGQAARAEAADLKQVAGTGQIVSFGSRYGLKARLRPSDEHPANPDAYSVNIGLTKVRGRTDYAPIRELTEFKK
jgi:hypothetical protein